jgi:hypothetical protein
MGLIENLVAKVPDDLRSEVQAAVAVLKQGKPSTAAERCRTPSIGCKHMFVAQHSRNVGGARR